MQETKYSSSGPLILFFKNKTQILNSLLFVVSYHLGFLISVSFPSSGPAQEHVIRLIY